MGESIYPQAANLSAFLTGAGLSATVIAGFDLDQAVRAGVDAFESATSRRFLADKDNSTRYFDLNGSDTLYFGADLATFSSAVYQPQGLAALPLVLNTDFRLGPYNAAAEAKPYQWLVMLLRNWRRPSLASVQVTGRWGYGDEMPEDAWIAMLHGAALWLFPGARYRMTGGMIGYKEGDASRDFGIQAFTDILKAWLSSYDAAVSRYKRVAVG